MLARRCAQLEAGADLSAAPSISQKLRELLDAVEPARIGGSAATAGLYAALFATAPAAAGGSDYAPAGALLSGGACNRAIDVCNTKLPISNTAPPS